MFHDSWRLDYIFVTQIAVGPHISPHAFAGSLLRRFGVHVHPVQIQCPDLVSWPNSRDAHSGVRFRRGLQPAFVRRQPGSPRLPNFRLEHRFCWQPRRTDGVLDGPGEKTTLYLPCSSYHECTTVAEDGSCPRLLCMLPFQVHSKIRSSLGGGILLASLEASSPVCSYMISLRPLSIRSPFTQLLCTVVEFALLRSCRGIDRGQISSFIHVVGGGPFVFRVDTGRAAFVRSQLCLAIPQLVQGQDICFLHIALEVLQSALRIDGIVFFQAHFLKSSASPRAPVFS